MYFYKYYCISDDFIEICNMYKYLNDCKDITIQNNNIKTNIYKEIEWSFDCNLNIDKLKNILNDFDIINTLDYQPCVKIDFFDFNTIM